MALVVTVCGTPAFAQVAPSYGYYAPMRAGMMDSGGSWHVNMSDVSGKLVDISPVAARVRLDNRTTRTFSISHGQYERLREDVGRRISFDVRHDVLYATSA